MDFEHRYAFDRRSQPGVPERVNSALPPQGAAALLVEYQCETEEERDERCRQRLRCEVLPRRCRWSGEPTWTLDRGTPGALWRVRKGS